MAKKSQNFEKEVFQKYKPDKGLVVAQIKRKKYMSCHQQQDRLYTGFMTAAGKAELQLFNVHTIGPILFVRILEVTYGKTQFSFLMTFFIRF